MRSKDDRMTAGHAVALVRDTTLAVWIAALILIVGSSHAQPQEQAPGTGAAATRAAQHSVLFANLPATISDVVQRVVLARADGRLTLQEVVFHRYPYRLSDGTLFVQTPGHDTSVFVRQVIENPLADRTLVLLPASELGGRHWAARLALLAEVRRLNPDRPLVLLLDSWTVAGTAGAEYIHAMETFRSRLTDDDLLALLLGAKHGSPPLDAVLAFYAATHAVSLAYASPATGDDPPEADDPRPNLDQLRLLYLTGAQSFVDEIVFGQLVLVAGRVQRAIQTVVGDGSQLPRSQLDELNALLNQLAPIFARIDSRPLIDDPDRSEAAALMRSIDELVGSETLEVFLSGLAQIQELITTELAASIEPVLRVHADLVNEHEKASAGTRRVIAARTAVAGLQPGSIALLRVPDDDVYEHIAWCARSEAYNCVVVGDGGGSRPRMPDDRVYDLLRADRPVTAPLVPEQSIFIHPEVRRADVRQAAASSPSLLLERVRVAYERISRSENEIVVTYLPHDRLGGVITILLPTGFSSHDVGPAVRQYVIPGSSFPEQLRFVRDLRPDHGLTQDEIDILHEWMVVARTALNL